MRSRFFSLTALAAISFCSSPASAAEKPNIIFILVDDMGYGDYGVFYQNLRKQNNDRAEPWHFTPHLDTMAGEGLQLRQHYCAAPVCAPSRASLLSGVHQGHANVRDNQFDKALEENHTLGTVMRGAGYATAAIGKWGLQGGPGEKSPNAKNAGLKDWAAFPTKRGFDYYYGYVRHVDGHWHYPKEDGRQVWENDREVSADLAGCYTADLFTARAKRWIADQHTAHPEQPFFMYLAYDTPHAKLQLPPSAYPAGGGFQGGVQWLGTPGHMINTAGTPDSYMHPDYAGATWDHDHDPATPEQPWPNVYQRYATDVRRLDDCVGDLFALLQDLKIDRETLVVFTTDNGPSRESYLPEKYEPEFFNSFGPFDGIKRDCWEGGIRTGALVRWPGGAAPQRVSEQPCQAHDWMPTFAQLAGVAAPARCDGASLVPTITGRGEQKPTQVYVEYMEGGKTPNYAEFLPSHRDRVRKNMQMLRLGDLVGVRYNVQAHADPFEIYNIVSDPKEAHNLDGEKPGLQHILHELVLGMRRPDASAPRPYDKELVPASSIVNLKPGLKWQSFAKAAPWLARLDDLSPVASGESAKIEAVAVGRGDDVLFSGYLEVPADGEYTFSAPAGASALLRVHEATVLDCAFAPAAAAVSGKILLRAGPHPFRLYWQNGAAAPQLDVTAPAGAVKYSH